MLALRSVHVRARLPRREHARRARRAPRRRSSGSSTHLLERGDSRRRRSSTIVAGMTDRFALELRCERSEWPASRTTSVREAVERGRHRRGRRGAHAAAQGRARADRASARSTRRGRRASPVNPADKLYYCFGCGKGGDVITFVRETREPRLRAARSSGWPSASASRSSTRRPRPRQDARARQRGAAARAARAGDRVLRALPLGIAEPASAARRTSRRAASARRSVAAFRLGPRARRRDARARRRARRASPREELRAAGLVDSPRRRLLQRAPARSRSPTRAGACVGFQARKLREDDPLRAKYVNSPEGELFRKGDLLYGLDRARAAIAKQDRAVVVEGNTDVLALRQAGLRAGRRVDGHRAHRAAADASSRG